MFIDCQKVGSPLFRRRALPVRRTVNKKTNNLLFLRYQMKLMSIDNLRKDGKFYDDRGHIPEGQ